MRHLYNGLLSVALRFLGFSIGPQLVYFDIDASLPLTVSNGSHSKVVNAYIDTGSNYSFISPRLIKKLQVETSQRNGDTVAKVTVSRPSKKPGDKYYDDSNATEIELIENRTTNVFLKKGTSKRRLPTCLFVKLVRHLNIPLCPPSSIGYDLLLGTDLITSLLTPRTHSPRVISICANLSAFETRFGYYLQGIQTNLQLDDILFNWRSYSDVYSSRWRSLAPCLLFDFIFFGLVLSTYNFCYKEC